MPRAGVIHIPAGQLALAQEDASYQVKHDLFDFLDGLPGTPAQFRPIPSAVLGSDGRIWLATTSGVVSVEPNRIQRNPLPAPVSIRQLKANGNSYASWETPTLQPHTESVQIDYTGLSLSIPERVRFRYRLEGVDNDWQEAGGRREAFYTRLGPGKYRFQVIAANNDGIWNEEGDSLEFSIAPAFYQTSWVVILCVAAFLLLLYLLYMLRLKQLASHIRSRLHERHLERERIARELHDTLLQGIQGLILRFQAVTESIPVQEPARAAMERALDRADQVLVEGRDRVLELRAASTYSGDLEQVFTQLGEDLRQDQAVAFRVSSQGAPQSLDPIVRDEIFRIGREALFNACRHANASLIEVEILQNRDELRLRFLDDGRGVDAKVMEAGGKPGHWGFSGMRERAERIGGRLSIWSRSGSGTEVELRLPAASAYRPCLKQSRWKWWRNWFPG